MFELVLILSLVGYPDSPPLRMRIEQPIVRYDDCVTMGKALGEAAMRTGKVSMIAVSCKPIDRGSLLIG